MSQPACTALRAAFALSVLCLALEAGAAPVTVTTTGHWLENRSTNTIGRGPGLRQILYAEAIPNGLNGTTATAAQGGLVIAMPYTGTTAVPNEFSASVAANPALYGAWQLTFANGANTTNVFTPAIASGLAPMPFAQSVLMTSTPAATSFSWSLPPSAAVDAVRFNLWDHGRLNLAGTNVDNVFNRTVAPTTTSFTLPATLANGLPLQAGNLYTLEINLLDFASNAINAPQSDIRNRSRLFVDFVAGSTPAAGAYLPIVEPGANGAPPVFRFDIGSVGSNLIYIDPPVAVGYRYAKGAGNPNFASLLLPSGIGDNLFRVVLDGGEEFSLAGGSEFRFAAGGVAGFTVLGIEESAGLAPNDPTAFVTGVSFTGPGAFTGTMQAVLVPEAPAWALWLGGLGVIAGLVRRRARQR